MTSIDLKKTCIVRRINKLLILFLLAICIIAHAASADSVFRVTLLGTGSPQPVMNRFGPSILVEAGNQKFLFDAGRGVLQRLMQAKVRWKDINALFLTHLHSDHLVGLPDLWLTGWLISDRRDTPLQIFGPEGTKNLMTHLRQAFDYDIGIRELDDKTSPTGIEVITTEIHQGVIFEKSGVKITAFDVDHLPVKPAFGYRIDYDGKSVVFSGDTRPTENLIRFAQGTNLLVHEVVVPEAFKQMNYHPERVAGIVKHHTTVEQAAEIFSRVKPQLAVYSHIVPPTASAEEIINRTKKIYSGDVQVGEDLMTIELGKSVTVHPAETSATKH